MGSSVELSPPAACSPAVFLNPTCLMKFTVDTAACAWALTTATRGPPSIDSKSILASSWPGVGMATPYFLRHDAVRAGQIGYVEGGGVPCRTVVCLLR